MRYLISYRKNYKKARAKKRLERFLKWCEKKGNIMDLLNDVLYHLSCPSCGSDWWDSNAFPSYCPYCNTNRVPERTDKKDEE